MNNLGLNVSEDEAFMVLHLYFFSSACSFLKTVDENLTCNVTRGVIYLTQDICNFKYLSQS